MSALFHTLFYNPIYNILVALINISPHGDAGIAIILLTIIVRLILLPLSLKAARTQRAMNSLNPKLKEIKARNKGNREKEAAETLALYRSAKVNPFSGILVALVQIPVLFALYWVFRYEPFTSFDMARLYSFTPLPHLISPLFLGLVSVTSTKNLLFAVLAGITQFFQAHFALSGTASPKNNTGRADFQKMMGTQLKFIFPFFIALITYTIKVAGVAIALYFITTNIFGTIQELYVRKKFRAPLEQAS